MASSLTAARRRAFTGRRVLVTLAAAAGVAVTSFPAVAAPETPENSQEAAALVATRAHDLEVVTEDFNEARVQLETQQAEAAEAAEQVQAADAAVDDARDKVREVARSAYTGDQLGTLQAMLTSESADQLLDRISTLDTIAQHNNGILGAAQETTAAAVASKAAADEAAAAAEEQVDRVSAQQAALQSQIAEYQADLDRLTAEEQQRAAELAEQQHAAAPAAAAPADDRSAPAASRSTTRQPAPPPAPVAAGSGAAQTAVDTALAQLGDPYVWAAAGPNAFDCSGLTQYAFAAAGVSLPHSSRVQATMGSPVSLSALQPGDLLFYYSPVSHVGMYIGNGQMVHASTSGQPVKIGSINGMGSAPFARRITG